MEISYAYSHQFSSRFIYRQNNPQMLGNLHCFPTQAIRNLNTQQDGKSTGQLDVPACRVVGHSCRLWKGI